MLIIGAKGLAKEVLSIFNQVGELDELHFYDDLTTDIASTLYGRFPVIKSMEGVTDLFKKNKRFIVAVGNPLLRFKLYEIFTKAGGQYSSVISPVASVGNFGTQIGAGTIIMAGAVVTNDVQIGIGGLINPNCTISHDSSIGSFVEISPGVQVTGHCQVGDFCSIGANATILPKVKLGDRVIVGAGAVVTKNVPDGMTVVGIPARVMSKDF